VIFVYDAGLWFGHVVQSDIASDWRCLSYERSRRENPQAIFAGSFSKKEETAKNKRNEGKERIRVAWTGHSKSYCGRFETSL
jgi:hypothetical protein